MDNNVVTRFIVKLSRVLGVPILLIDTFLIFSSSPLIAGSAVLILVVTISGEVFLYKLTLKWDDQGDYTSVNAERHSRGGNMN